MLDQYLQNSSNSLPNKVALLFEGRSWTYREVDETVQRLANGLKVRGVRAGDRVAFYLNNSPELVFCYFACFRLGAVAVPIWPLLRGPEIAFALTHSKSRMLFTEPELYPEVASILASCPTLEHTILTKSSLRLQRVSPMSELLDVGTQKHFSPLVSPDQPAIIIYTSGSTGKPKGVTHSHFSLDKTAQNHAAQVRFGTEDIVAVLTSMSHIASFSCQLLETVLVGATLLVIGPFDPDRAAQAIERYRATKAFGLPTFFNAILNHPVASNRNLSSLQFCMVGGDSLPVKLAEEFMGHFGVNLLEACGMSEIAPFSVHSLAIECRAGSIGKPASGVSIRIVDGFGMDVPPGEVGEIWVKSEALMVGYWEDPQLTATCFTDGWFHTGDLARFDADGYVWFAGRKKEVIVRGGEKVFPQEIESVLLQHPDIAEAGVVGLTGDRKIFGDTIVAHVVTKPGKLPSTENLSAFLKSRMAEYKVPDRYVFATSLPRTSVGKLARRLLRAGE